VTLENGKQVLYVELRKELYGTLRAALLFWRKLSTQLIEWGFEKNPYDWCVADKQVYGTQCTIIWHVDDLKISHVDSEVVSAIIKDLESVFGQEASLTVTRGKVHEYLGMLLDFTQEATVQIKIQDYVNA
jgi:Reverse transcriptase (RNA-dependent DNA polymerase)